MSDKKKVGCHLGNRSFTCGALAVALIVLAIIAAVAIFFVRPWIVKPTATATPTATEASPTATPTLLPDFTPTATPQAPTPTPLQDLTPTLTQTPVASPTYTQTPESTESYEQPTEQVVETASCWNSYIEGWATSPSCYGWTVPPGTNGIPRPNERRGWLWRFANIIR